MKKICIIDGRSDNLVNNSLLSLLLGDNMIIEYPINAAVNSMLFSQIYVLTDSHYLANKLKGISNVIIADDVPDRAGDEQVWVVSGRAPFITESTLRRCAELCKNGGGIARLRAGILALST